MLKLIRTAVLAATLGATALVATAAPAEAHNRYRHRGGGDDAAIAIGAGLVGLAIGAAIASDRRDRYYDDDYYYDDRRRGYYPRYRTYNGYQVYRRYDRRYRDRRDYRRYRDYDRRYYRGYGY